MGELLGYARVSTVDQDAGLQLDALQGAGCVRVFSDTASGALDERPELARALDHLRAGDTLVVWRLDRLGGIVAGGSIVVLALGYLFFVRLQTSFAKLV